MSCSYRRNCVAAALLPLFLSIKVVAAPSIDSTRPDAPGITQAYESAFKNYQPATDETTSPDKLWRGANDAVAGQGGHGGMAGMQMDGRMTMSMPGSGEKPMPMDMKMPMNHNMKIQDGQAMPMGKKMPSQKAAPSPGSASPAGHGGMQMPGANTKSIDMTMPMDHSMPLPAGRAMSMGKAMPMPKNAPKDVPASAMPMPPGMDMHEGHKGQ